MFCSSQHRKVGNSGNSGMNIGRFGSHLWTQTGNTWEQARAPIWEPGDFVPSVPNRRTRAGNAQPRMNTGCSQCSHLFPTFLCRLRENIKRRAIDLLFRNHWFYSEFAAVAVATNGPTPAAAASRLLTNPKIMGALKSTGLERRGERRRLWTWQRNEQKPTQHSDRP